MKPSNEIIEKFQKIYLEEFGEEISWETAYDKFLKLVNLLRTVIKTGDDPSGFDQDRVKGKISMP